MRRVFPNSTDPLTVYIDRPFGVAEAARARAWRRSRARLAANGFECADHARRALDYFNQMRGHPNETANLEEDCVDLIANLLHVVERQTGMRVGDCLRIARDHFDVENDAEYGTAHPREAA